MNVRQVLLERKSTRAFLERPVPESTIESLLDGARHAPSGANTQPWQVAVVTGATKGRLQEAMQERFRRGERGEMDYRYYPEHWFSPYTERRRACGMQLYGALDISRADKQRQADQWAANYRAFDAPVALYFFMDAGLATGSFVDFGMFLQSLMLLAVEEGLASCPQAALGEYPELVKQELGYPADSILLCGMALGYEDTAAAVNSYRTPREDVDAFTRFFD
ncbi:MAG: nitroreductase [Mariprofundaceae bacterium]